MKKIIIFAILITCFVPSTHQQLFEDFFGILDDIGIGINTTDALKSALEKIDLKKILEKPSTKMELKQQWGIDPKIVEAAIGDVQMKDLLKSFNLKFILEAKLRGILSSKHWRKVLQGIDFSKLLLNFNYAKMMQTQAALDRVKNLTKLNEEVVKAIISSIDYKKLVQSVNWNKTLMERTMNTNTLLNNTNLQQYFSSIDMNKILKNKAVLDIIKQQIGIDLSILQSINVNEVLKTIDLKKLVAAASSGNTSEIMKVVVAGIDPTKLFKYFNVMNIAKMLIGDLGPIMPKLSSSCLVELASLTEPFRNSSAQDMIGKLFTAPLGKYVDSWGKPPARILLGNMHWFGGYDECKSIPDAKYCLAGMLIIGKLPGAYGTCMPKGCTYEDNLKILNVMGKGAS